MTDPSQREAILYAFAVEPDHDRATLERYLKDYPDLAEELIDLSSELRLSEMLGSQGVREQPDLEADAAWKEFLACKPQTPAAAAVNPLSRYKGQAFASLATAMNVPRSILTALRDGLVDPSSVPSGFLGRLASATETSIDSLRPSLAASQHAAALAFKSDTKPTHQGQTTFRQLVQNTRMSDEQRHLLLQECDADGLA